MATGQTLQLSSRQTLRALEHIDLLDLLTGQLLAGEPGPGMAGQHATARQTMVEDPDTGQHGLLPTATLQLIRTAGLAALAARTLAAPGVVTAAVFGSGGRLQLHVGVLARYLPTLSHVALSGPVADPLAPLDRTLLERVEEAGLGLSAAVTPRQAALGANLFVVAGQDRPLDLGPLPVGALLVNSSGQDLPRPVVAAADRLYVDDRRLLEANRHREFVRLHLAGAPAAPPSLLPHREGWYRHQPAGHGWPHVAADLADVLRGTAAGRTNDDESLLAELLGTDAVDLELGRQLHRAAIAYGLGSWVDQP